MESSQWTLEMNHVTQVVGGLTVNGAATLDEDLADLGGLQLALLALEEAGGTITHHHAVGRTHMPWYRRERPALFGAALAMVWPSRALTGKIMPGSTLSTRGLAQELGVSQTPVREALKALRASLALMIPAMIPKGL